MNREPLVIAPGQTDRNYWRDLWRYRELFHVLAWRDLAVRYKQTIVGLAWALLTMIGFTIVFGRLAACPARATHPMH